MKAFSVFRRFSMAYLWLIVNFSNPLKEMYNYVLRVVVLFVSILCVNVTYSQDHLIEVKRLPGWGKDYLTIVDSKKYLDPIDKTVKTFGYEYYCMMKNGLLVMKINDVSTKGMSEDAFYSILDANDETKLLLMDNSTTGLYLTTVKKCRCPICFYDIISLLKIYVRIQHIVMIEIYQISKIKLRIEMRNLKSSMRIAQK